MRKIMSQQNFTRYPKVLEFIRSSEQLFRNIQSMESVMPLQDEERLFIDAIRDMNYQASRMQAEEKSDDAEIEELDVHQVANESGAKPPLSIRINSNDIVDRLDEATMLAVDAAKRLNQNNISPNITSALGWIQATKSIQSPAVTVMEHEEEEEEDVAGAGTDQEAGEDNESNHSCDDNSSIVSVSLGKRSVVQPTAEELLQDMKRSRST